MIYRLVSSILILTLVLVVFIPLSLSVAHSQEAQPALFKSPQLLSGQVYTLVDPPRFDIEDWSIDGQFLNFSELKPGDFNGDGRSDLLLREQRSENILLLPSDSNKRFSLKKWTGLTFNQNFDSIAIGDFDVNGCDDVAVPTLNSTTWTFFLSNCANGFEPKQVALFSSNFKVDYSFSQTDIDKICPNVMACVMNDKRRNCYWSECRNFLEYKQTKYLEGAFGVPFSGDFLGSGQSHVAARVNDLYWNDKNGAWWTLSYVVGSHGPFSWASFDSGYKWGRGLVGDFNGDGQDDIFVSSDSLLGSWIGVSIGFTAIELPVKGEPILIDTTEERRKGVEFAAGDFNGDGIDEIVSVNKSESGSTRAKIYSWKKVAYVDGVSIRLNTHTEPNKNLTPNQFYNQQYSVTTDSEGRYSIRVPDTGIIDIEASKESLGFTKSVRRIGLGQNTARNQKINFVAVPPKPQEIIGSALSESDKNTSKGPYVCLGYNFSQTKKITKWGIESSVDCPANYAVFATAPSNTVSKTNESVWVTGTCCRLPADDILTDEQVFVTDRCPPGFVVTASTEFPSDHSRAVKMRCTKINSKRYNLASALPSVVYGNSTALRNWKNRIDIEEIPLALRYGVQRVAYNEWASHGCVGQPWGSILVAKGVGGCPGMLFSQLLYSGVQGDPSAGTAVKVFPDCSSIENIYDPRSGCTP